MVEIEFTIKYYHIKYKPELLWNMPFIKKTFSYQREEQKYVCNIFQEQWKVKQSNLNLPEVHSVHYLWLLNT